MSSPGFAVNVLALMKLPWSAGPAVAESLCLFADYRRTVVGVVDSKMTSGRRLEKQN